MMLAFLLVPTVFAGLESIGTFKQGETIELRQTCSGSTYSNITAVTLPINGTKVLGEVEMTKSGSQYNYTFSQTEVIGRYYVDGVCDEEGTGTTWTYYFTITPSGSDVGDTGNFLGILVFIIFAISCFFLYLTTRIEEPGFKVFFLLISFIFLMGTIGTATVISLNSGLPEAIGSVLSTILFVLGMILFIIFIFVMIRQTVAVLELYRMKKGYLGNTTMSVGSGYNVIGRRGLY